MSRVSVQIPTLNSASTLRLCLESVAKQDYPDIETLVIDSGSRDSTVQLARSFRATVVASTAGLLWSRIRGIESTDAEIIMFLDSDQVLEPTTVRRVIEVLERSDMAILEERALNMAGLMARLYDADRRIGQAPGASSHPVRGVQMPRAFRATVLKRAVTAIPQSLPSNLRYPDHAIIYFESFRLSERVALVRHAVAHIENTSIVNLLLKHVQYGKDARAVRDQGRYRELVAGKGSHRPIPVQSNLFKYWVGAEALLAMKAFPYFVGFASRTAGDRRTPT